MCCLRRSASEMYPDGFATTIEVAGLSEPLEGAARAAPPTFAASRRSSPKLLNIVNPDVAYFGQKDAQQAAVIRRMARDLDMACGDRGSSDRARGRRAARCRAETPTSAARIACVRPGSGAR